MEWEKVVQLQNGRFGSNAVATGVPRADCIAANAEWCDLPAEAVEECQAFGRKVESDYNMSLIAHHLHKKIYPARAGDPAGSSKQCAVHPNPNLVRSRMGSQITHYFAL